MRKSLQLPSLLVNIILLLAFAAGWIAFAPIKLGGTVTYVLVNGISMLPNFHTNDLVLVRKASTYHVGDVVTYQDALTGSPIIHRIIALDQDHYIFKGDNNAWVDAYHPTNNEMLGKLWIHLPQVGLVFLWLHTPLNMALAAGLLGGILMTSINTPPSKGGKAKKRNQGNVSPGEFDMALYVFGFFALLFLSLCIFALTRPLTRTGDDIQYEESGVFFYTASATPGVYDANVVHSGDPIFPKLTCALTVGFVYNISGSNLQNVAGTQSLDALISDESSGWQRTLPLASRTAFSGNTFSSTAPVDICQVQALIDSIEKETGFHSSAYTLTISPHVNVTASAGEQFLQDTFESGLVFRFDKVHFSLLKGSDPTLDPLRSDKKSTLKSTSIQPNVITVFNQDFDVLAVRWICIAGLVLSLAGLAILGWITWSTAQQSPEAYNKIRFGALIMDVQDAGFEKFPNVIDVLSIDDLAKMADRQGGMILHVTRPKQHIYFVQSEGATYRFVGTTNPDRPDHGFDASAPPHEFLPKGGLR